MFVCLCVCVVTQQSCLCNNMIDKYQMQENDSYHLLSTFKGQILLYVHWLFVVLADCQYYQHAPMACLSCACQPTSPTAPACLHGEFSLATGAYSAPHWAGCMYKELTILGATLNQQ